MGYFQGGLSQSDTGTVAQSENTENQQHVFIWTEAHRRAANQLEFAINSPTNVVLMLGKSGVGKSRLIEEVVEFVLIDQAVAYLTDPGCLDEDLVGIVREAVLGLADSYAQNVVPIFIVDDADKLHHDTLAKLVRMSHPNDGGDPVFKLVLVARPGFDETMQSIVPGLTGPAFQIWPLDENEAGAFVDEWLKVCGLGDILSDEDQREKMLERADGLPGALIGAIEWHAQKAGKSTSAAKKPAETSPEASGEPSAPDFSALRKASMAKASETPPKAATTDDQPEVSQPVEEVAPNAAEEAPKIASSAVEEQAAPRAEAQEIEPVAKAPEAESPVPAKTVLRLEDEKPEPAAAAPKSEPAPPKVAEPAQAAPREEMVEPRVAAKEPAPVMPKRPVTLKEMADAENSQQQPKESALEPVGLSRLERAMLLKGKGSTQPTARAATPKPKPQTLESQESRERLERMARAALSLTPQSMEPQDHPDLNVEQLPETTRRRLSGGDIVLGLVAASLGVLTSFAIDRYPVADWNLPPALAAKVDALESVALPRVQSFVSDLTQDG